MDFSLSGVHYDWRTCHARKQEWNPNLPGTITSVDWDTEFGRGFETPLHLSKWSCLFNKLKANYLAVGWELREACSLIGGTTSIHTQHSIWLSICLFTSVLELSSSCQLNTNDWWASYIIREWETQEGAQGQLLSSCLLAPTWWPPLDRNSGRYRGM